MKFELDFSLRDAELRCAALKEMQEALPGATSRQLDLLADYLLTSLPSEQQDFTCVSMKRSFGRREPAASLEALLEASPAGGASSALTGASSVFDPSAPKYTVRRRSVLNRDEVEQRFVKYNTSDEVRQHWHDLWRRIDETEYAVQRYEALIGKRRKDLPIRAELVSRIQGYGVQDELEQRAAALVETAVNGYSYEALRLKRQLVELRKEQYVLLDDLKGEQVRRHAPGTSSPTHASEPLSLPLYPFNDKKMRAASIDSIEERHFSYKFCAPAIEDLQRLDQLDNTAPHLDLRNATHLRAIIHDLPDLDIQARKPWSIKTQDARDLIAWLRFYIEWSGVLKVPELRLTLRGKAEGKKNVDIVEDIKEACGKEYKPNYISILYARRVLPLIAKAAEEHVRLIEFILMGRQVFKTCSTCGALLPRNSSYFYRRQHSCDGFSGSCKECTKVRSMSMVNDGGEQDG